MGKFKPARAKKKGASSRGAVPCLILLVSGIALISLLFYAILKSAGS
jgi:hypothetical protein